MEGAPRGKVILIAVPGGEERERLALFLTRVFRNASPEKVEAILSQPLPRILAGNAPEPEGRRLVEELRKLGADAGFLPLPPPADGGEPPVFPPPSDPPSPPPASPPSPDPGPAMEGPAPPAAPRPFRLLFPPPPPPPRAARRLLAAGGALLLAGAALFAAGFLGWRFPRPLAPLQGPVDRFRGALGLAPSGLHTPNPCDFSHLSPLFAPPPGVLQVPPDRMTGALEDQLTERPDRRFLMAFEVATRRWEQMRGVAPGTFRPGTPELERDLTRLPLLRGGRRVGEVPLAAEPGFTDALLALELWLKALDREKGGRWPAGRGAVPKDPRLGEAGRLIDTTDPATVLVGLSALEALVQEKEEAPPAALLLAARGYATLTFTLKYDRTERADRFGAEALAFLALARHLDPSLSSAREEAFLALALDYTAHAREAAGRPPEGAPGREGLILDAFLRKDLASLEGMRGAVGPGPEDVLLRTLTVRLAWDLALWDKARKEGLGLLDKSPTWGAMLENINVGDIAVEKALTVLLPLSILSAMEKTVSPDLLADKKTLEERARGLAGEEATGVVGLGRFEELLAGWKPFGEKDRACLLVDADRVREGFRVLYSIALQERFDLLLERWAVPELARSFAESVSQGADQDLLGIEMRAAVAAEFGDRQKALDLRTAILSRPDARGKIYHRAYERAGWPMREDPLRFPALAARLDGRPFHRYLLGWTCANRTRDLDAAARLLLRGARLDPTSLEILALLGEVRGSTLPLREEAERRPRDHLLLLKVGEVLEDRGDFGSLVEAEGFYARAQSLAPPVMAIAQARARVLRRQGRFPEALRVLEEWNRGFGGRGDLDDLVMRAAPARVYLAMGQPRKAREVVGDLAGSYQAGIMDLLARALEGTRDFAGATETYRRMRERYPTSGWIAVAEAGFRWRRGDEEGAAKVLSSARAAGGEGGRWFVKEFGTAFAGLPFERGKRALDQLKRNGATLDEMGFIAGEMSWRKRDDLAFEAVAGMPARVPMLAMQAVIESYGFLRKGRGREAADRFLAQALPPGTDGLIKMTLFFADGQYEAVLDACGPLEAVRADWRESGWLTALLAWKALGEKDPGWGRRFEDHYIAEQGPDHYYAFGRFLMGRTGQASLLPLLDDGKKRCEGAYYLGFSSRLAGDFPAASRWYQACLQTGLENNGEYHNAANELYWWKAVGMDRRNRLPGDDRALIQALLDRRVEEE